MRASGTSKAMPKILAYPHLMPFASTPKIKGIFCYVIKHYGNYGLAVLIYRQLAKDQVNIMFGDWTGKTIDIRQLDRLGKIATDFIATDRHKLFLRTMQLIRLEQAQFFFAVDDADELTLVDMQVAINKLAGPGMIKNLFENTMKTQEVLKIETIDSRACEYLEKGSGSYAGDLILKPSNFKMTDTGPLYVELKR